MTASVGRPGHPAGEGGPLAGLAVYTMFRGSPAQLFGWCDFHLAHGADRLYVVLDRPAASLVAGLPDHPRISWEVVEQPTWDALYPPDRQHVERKQVDGFRLTARRARAAGHELLAFVDADELLLLHEPVAALAARHADATALVLPVREMWFDAAAEPAGPFSATLALRPSRPRAGDRGTAFGWRSQFLRHGVLGHAAGKTIYRLSEPTGEVTVHRPRSASPGVRSVELPHEVADLLHYDSGDPQTWNAKWASRLSGDTVARGLWPHRLAQQNLYAHELRRGPRHQERFFRDFFSFDQASQALLVARGLLDTVDVRQALAGALSATEPAPARGELVRLPAPARRVDFQFAMVCDRRFVRPTLATMASVLAQVGGLGSVRFVVLGDGLEEADVVTLRALAFTAGDVEVVVRDVTADLDRDVGTGDPKRATFGRIYLIDHLPEQRTVYLDGDVLATRDFTELFSLDLGDACLAGASDSAALRLVADPSGVPVAQGNRLHGITRGHPLEYVNGGVLVLALEHPDFRRLALEARALVVRQGRALAQRDQDAINLAFTGRKLLLPSTYNYMTQFFVSGRAVDDELAGRKYEAADASLIHFSGRIKPWEAPDDEFYNALYRRLVSRAEERLGVSCGLWFSAPSTHPADWGTDRWRDALGVGREPGATRPTLEPADLEVLVLHDRGLLLRVSADMHRLLGQSGLRVVGLVGDEELFSAPAAAVSPVLTHLARRVGHAVRRLPVDLGSALAPRGGVVRDVALVLSSPSPPGGAGRVVGTLDLLAAGPGVPTGLLDELGVDGGLTTLRDGWLSGWFRAGARGAERVVLLLDGEPVVVRRPDLAGSPDEQAAGAKRFTFHLAHLRRLGYGAGGHVEVRVAGSNVPLRGGALTVQDASRDQTHVDGVGWVAGEPERRTLGARLSSRVGRLVRERARD